MPRFYNLVVAVLLDQLHFWGILHLHVAVVRVATGTCTLLLTQRLQRVFRSNHTPRPGSLVFGLIFNLLVRRLAIRVAE